MVKYDTILERNAHWSETAIRLGAAGLGWGRRGRVQGGGCASQGSYHEELAPSNHEVLRLDVPA
jgi:hypothetical protein